MGMFNIQMMQYATPTVIGENEVQLPNSIKSYLPQWTIEGNTEQIQYTGSNLFDASKTILTGCEWQDNAIMSTSNSVYVDIAVPAGKYTLTFERNAEFQIYLVNGMLSSGYFASIAATATTSTFNFTASYDGYLRIKWFGVGNAISNVQLLSLDTIRNAGDNGFKIEVRSKNLLNPALYRQNIYRYEGINVQGEGEDIIMQGTATRTVYNGLISTPDQLTPIPQTLPGKTLYISKIQTGLYTDTPVEIGFYRNQKDPAAVFTAVKNNNTYSVVNVPKDCKLWWIRLRFTKDVTYDERIKLMISESAPIDSFYEPYIGTTISIPASVENIKLQFGEKDKMIKMQQSIKYIQYSPDSWDVTIPYSEQWLDTPIEHDITDTELGQQLMQGLILRPDYTGLNLTNNTLPQLITAKYLTHAYYKPIETKVIDNPPEYEVTASELNMYTLTNDSGTELVIR